MTDFPTPKRESRSARALLLAFGAACLLMFPAQAAQAQLPPAEDCVTNPASCAPDTGVTPTPDIDKCLSDPANCLPDPPPLPPVDECTKNPASCLPDSPLPGVLPDPEDCVKGLPGCAPEPDEVDRCVKDVARCLEPGQSENDDGGGDEDDRGGAAPGEGNQPPRHTPEAAAGSGDRAATGNVDATEPSPQAGPQIGTAAFASNDGIVNQIQRGLADAAQRFAFPLMVAALVGAFLVVQGRIDRKDPKLVAAPIVSHDDQVSFR